MKYEFDNYYGEFILITNLEHLPYAPKVWESPRLTLKIPFSNIPNYNPETGIIYEKDFYKFVHHSGNYEEMVEQLRVFLIKEML